MSKEIQIGLPIFVGALFLLGGFFLFWNSFDWVDAGELGVGVNFGKVVGVYNPGFQYTGLFTAIYPYDMRTRSIEVILDGGNTFAPTKDGQKIVAKIAVNYNLKRDAETVTSAYENIGTDELLASRLNIESIVREGFKQVVVTYNATSILDKRAEIKEKAIENIQANFPTYFTIGNVIITDIGYTQEYQNILDATQNAAKNVELERNKVQVIQQQQAQEIAKASGAANISVISAEASKKITILAAEADAEKIKLAGEAQAAALRAQRVEITPLMVQKAAIEKWNGAYPNWLMMGGNDKSFLIQIPANATGREN